MTTNIKVKIINNIFQDNNIFSLKKIDGIDYLSGILLLKKVESSRCETYLQVSEYIFQKIVDNLVDSNIWLFSAFSTPNNKIFKYKYSKYFWKETYNIEVSPNNIKDFLRVIESKTNIKYYHIIDITFDKNLRNVLIKRIFCTQMTYSKYIIALPKNVDIKNALEIDWYKFELFDKELIRFVTNNNGIIFREYGWFDDSHSGFIGIGNEQIINKLL